MAENFLIFNLIYNREASWLSGENPTSIHQKISKNRVIIDSPSEGLLLFQFRDKKALKVLCLFTPSPRPPPPFLLYLSLTHTYTVSLFLYTSIFTLVELPFSFYLCIFLPLLRTRRQTDTHRHIQTNEHRTLFNKLIKPNFVWTVWSRVK